MSTETLQRSFTWVWLSASAES